jgi:hypothetical protein
MTDSFTIHRNAATRYRRPNMPKFPVTNTKTDPVTREAAQELSRLRPGSVLRAISPTVIMVLNHSNVPDKVWKTSAKALRDGADRG